MSEPDIEQIKKAVGETIKSPEIVEAISQSVKGSLEKTLAGALVVYAQGAPQDTAKSDSDPYRTTIHFLAGAITFCLTLIIGIANAIPAQRLVFFSPTYMMLGGVLAWISIAALVATCCMAIAQTGKKAYRDKMSGEMPDKPAKFLGAVLDIPTARLLLWLKLAPVFPAILATVFCVLAGWTMLNNDATSIFSSFIAVEGSSKGN